MHSLISIHPNAILYIYIYLLHSHLYTSPSSYLQCQYTLFVRYRILFDANLLFQSVSISLHMFRDCPEDFPKLRETLKFSKKWSSTMHPVIHSPYQFSPHAPFFAHLVILCVNLLSLFYGNKRSTRFDFVQSSFVCCILDSKNCWPLSLEPNISCCVFSLACSRSCLHCSWASIVVGILFSMDNSAM